MQYILAQTFGAFLAALAVYGQYKQQLDGIHAALVAGGAQTQALIFTNKGPAGVLALFTAPGQDLGSVFLNEFLVCIVRRPVSHGVTDSADSMQFLTILVFSVLDNSNLFVSFSSAPFTIGA